MSNGAPCPSLSSTRHVSRGMCRGGKGGGSLDQQLEGIFRIRGGGGKTISSSNIATERNNNTAARTFSLRMPRIVFPLSLTQLMFLCERTLFLRIKLNSRDGGFVFFAHKHTLFPYQLCLLPSFLVCRRRPPPSRSLLPWPHYVICGNQSMLPSSSVAPCTYGHIPCCSTTYVAMSVCFCPGLFRRAIPLKKPLCTVVLA